MTTLLPLLLSVVACVELPNIGGDDTGTADTGLDTNPIQDCAAGFTVGFPDAPEVAIDGCADASLDATWEFDPDDPPEMRSYTATFNAATEAGFECSVRIAQLGVCGGGYYGVGVDDTSGVGAVSVVIDTSDCTGVEDDWEGQHAATEGWIRLARVTGGTRPGDFTGRPVQTVIIGELHVEAAGGLVLSGDFELTGTVVGSDAEQSACYGSDGDEDGDGHKDERFGGDDCDDGDPELVTGDTWWVDADNDGYGDEHGDVFACEQPADTVDNGDDCDDGDRRINPDGVESCDEQDQDCDGQVDEDATDATSWYRDADSDGYGARTGASIEACDEPAGYAASHDDCDDGAAEVNPGATEIANNDVDEDCDGDSDSTGIYAVQDGTYADGDSVTLPGVIVTATSRYGFWVQESAGGPWSGLWIYAQDDWEDDYPGVVTGKQVTVSGEINEYDGLTELDFSLGGGAVTVTGNPGAPAPESVSVGDLSGASAEAWEGVLVAVGSLSVVDPDLGFGQFSVSDGSDTLVVDDIIYGFTSNLRAGSSFTGLAGVFHYAYGQYVLLPRDSGDFSGFSF